MSLPSLTPPATIANGPSGCDERHFRIAPGPASPGEALFKFAQFLNATPK